MGIHKEGYNTLLISLIALAIINFVFGYFFPKQLIILAALAIASLVVMAFLFYFFRYPNRTTTRNENEILSPADGKVVVIEEIEETEYFNEKRLQVSIFMSPLNVHANWYPVSGEVGSSKYHNGKYMVAWHPKASSDNERTAVLLNMSNGVSILVKQIAGAVARRIVCYPRKGDKIKQGAELGFIKFGSRVDLILPANVEVCVKLNQKVKGKLTKIAEFK
ncbi:MAG: phosphatidylserine decarboxylase family protein [Bacteroidia bacterium]|nr:phosphatidylserine decarboxylase family protein [Bacteroidia bacterium]